MPVNFLSVNGVPATITQDGTPGADATLLVNWGVDSQSIVEVAVFATPVDGGSPVFVGNSDRFLVSGPNSGTLEIPINVDNLDTGKDYEFSARNVSNNFSSGPSASVDIVPCFAEGVLIMTPRGQVAVQDLRVGDSVLTMESGAALKPIRWIGHACINLLRHPNRAAVAPILIRACALADGVPARDLRVSPEHAMFLDGRLVPARLLLNGRSIIQELWCPEVTYWHVELPAHGLLVAEGAISESYFDDGNRKHFDNAAIATLVKDFSSERANGRYAEAACRPLLLDGPALDALRARMADRAAALPARLLSA
jgi:hypothetical protein